MNVLQKVRLALSVLILASIGIPASAATIRIAVASNFTDAAKDIAAAFKQKTGHDVLLSFGASGTFYTQITQDAPFQIFLSADELRPKTLIADGFGCVCSHRHRNHICLSTSVCSSHSVCLWRGKVSSYSRVWRNGSSGVSDGWHKSCDICSKWNSESNSFSSFVNCGTTCLSGNGKPVDTNYFYVIGVNNLGSCFSSVGRAVHS